jgi:hypothetical protein
VEVASEKFPRLQQGVHFELRIHTADGPREQGVAGSWIILSWLVTLPSVLALNMLALLSPIAVCTSCAETERSAIATFFGTSTLARLVVGPMYVH